MLNWEWITANWTWCLSALSIIGVWLNNHKDKRCFQLWIVTNFCWMVVDFQVHEFDTRLLVQPVQYAVLFVLAQDGLILWKRTEKITEVNND